MNTLNRRYRGHRFPPEIISYAVWLYHRFTLSFRDIEDLLAERGIIVSYESIRCWCLKFGPDCNGALKRREGQLGDRWYADEVFVSINGQIHYLWRAVDQDGDVLDILVQRKRDARAAKRFFRKILNSQGESPNWLFKSRHQAQRFLSLHARVGNLFRYGRHRMRAVNHRLFRARAFDTWSQVTCA